MCDFFGTKKINRSPDDLGARVSRYQRKKIGLTEETYRYM